MDSLTDEFVHRVCRLTGGTARCAFLVLGGEQWLCGKGLGPQHEAELRLKLDVGQTTAKGDNCSGPPDYERRVP